MNPHRFFSGLFLGALLFLPPSSLVGQASARHPMGGLQVDDPRIQRHVERLASHSPLFAEALAQVRQGSAPLYIVTHEGLEERSPTLYQRVAHVKGPAVFTSTSPGARAAEQQSILAIRELHLYRSPETVAFVLMQGVYAHLLRSLTPSHGGEPSASALLTFVR